MSTGYVRQSAGNIVTAMTINASDFNNEYNQLQSAFDKTTGHDHSGGTGLSQPIPLTTSVTGVLPVANGGTGVANGTNNTITFTGNYTLGLTLTGNTAVTIPTSGTLLTTGVTSLSSLTTVGTIGTGVWQASAIAGAYGGTGIANTGSTITVGGNFATTGAYACTFILTNTTSVTLPTSGTLVGTADSGSVSNTMLAGSITNAKLAGSITAAKLVLTDITSLSGLTTAAALVTVGTIATGTWQATKIGTVYGGTNADTSASTGVAQISSGTWSVSTALANGTTATKQSASDNSTKVATTSYVDSAVAASGGLILLATINASNAASFAFSSTYLTTTYRNYVIKLADLYGASNNTDLIMTISTNNGSGYLNTGYSGTSVYSSSGSGPTRNSVGTTSGNMTGSTTIMGQSTNTAGATINIYDPVSANQFTSDFIVISSGGAAICTGCITNSGTTAINNIKFTLSSGNIYCNAYLYAYSGY